MSCFGSWCFIRAQKVIQRVREEERKEVGREEGRKAEKEGRGKSKKAKRTRCLSPLANFQTALRALTLSPRLETQLIPRLAGCPWNLSVRLRGSKALLCKAERWLSLSLRQTGAPDSEEALEEFSLCGCAGRVVQVI